MGANARSKDRKFVFISKVKRKRELKVLVQQIVHRVMSTIYSIINLKDKLIFLIV